MTEPPPEPAAPERLVIAGVDRAHSASAAPKLAFFALHTLSLGLCAWLVLGGGLATVGGWFGAAWRVTEPTRATLMLGVTALYWARHGVTLFYLLVRRVTWSEALGLSGFILPVEVGLCILAAGVTRAVPLPLGAVGALAVALVLLGSFLNTGSEVQRKWWKARPSSKGHCYTEGLFALSMHINYFGDTVMFTGWCLLSGVWWTLGIAVMMTGLFVFMHIPGLDQYLEHRYGDEFRAYAKRTRKFVPFVY